MAATQFVSITLNSDSKTHSFDPDIDIGDPDSSVMSKSGLIVKQVILGHEAEAGDLNVVHVETQSVNGEGVIAPLAILEAGKQWFSALDFTFPDPPLVFTLVKGKGPVYIQGNTFQQIEDENVDEGEEDDDDSLSDGEKEQVRIMQENVLMKNESRKRKPAAESDEDEVVEGKKNGKTAKIAPVKGKK